jgi:Concanavalin A-like lectin/glucanases superfamily
MKARWIFVSILILSGFSGRCGAAVYNSNGTPENVQFIHDTQAQNGDTITLPAGTFTWNTQIRITKNITLSGAGQGVTFVYDNVTKSSGGDSTIPMLFTGITAYLRVTGFTLHGQAQDTNIYNKGEIRIDGTSHSARIDHVDIIQPGTGAIVISGDIWGVADHCTLDTTNGKQSFQIFTPNYGGGTNGDISWESPTNLGSGEGWYIENCTINGKGSAGYGVTDSTQGGRFVLRYNTINDEMAATHGTESQRYRGVRSFEIYNNTFTNDNTIMFCAIYLRGGTGVIWGNTAHGGLGQTGYRNFTQTDEYRVWNNWPMWGGLCNGSSPWDQNSQGDGYAAIDQVGRGTALDQVRNDPPINQRTGNAAWPRNQSEPVYLWNNNWTPVPNNFGVYISNPQSVIQTGRDIIDNGNTAKPGYTPYTYPHPLVTGGGPSPTPSASPTPTASATATSTPTATPTATPTSTPRPSPTPTPTPTPTATPTPSATPTPPASLVAAYSFNEGSGTIVNDASGNGNNGTISGATWTTSGKYGNALSFNGSNSRVTVPDSASLHLTTGMTLEAWVYPTVLSSAWRDVIEKGNDNYYLMATARFAAGVPATCGTWAEPPVYGTSVLLVNVWSHLASTYDGATLRLYVNGVQVASKSVSGSIAVTTDALTFGSDPFYGQYLSGRIDDIRIYNRPLTAAKIQADMNTPVGSR